MVKVEQVKSDGIPKASEGRRGEAACLEEFELDTGRDEVSFESGQATRTTLGHYD